MTNEHRHDALIGRLQLAQEIVERAQIHDALKPAAFAEVCREMDNREVAGETLHSEVGDRDDRDRNHNARPTGPASPSNRLIAVAEAFGVDAKVISQVFAEDGNELLFVLPSRRLSNTTRGAMRQITILVACARQAGGWDDAWTTAATLRVACERANVYSSKHFATVVGELDMFAVQGVGGNRQLRAHALSYAAGQTVLGQLGLLPNELND